MLFWSCFQSPNCDQQVLTTLKQTRRVIKIRTITKKCLSTEFEFWRKKSFMGCQISASQNRALSRHRKYLSILSQTFVDFAWRKSIWFFLNLLMLASIKGLSFLQHADTKRPGCLLTESEIYTFTISFLSHVFIYLFITCLFHLSTVMIFMFLILFMFCYPNFYLW